MKQRRGVPVSLALILVVLAAVQLAASSTGIFDSVIDQLDLLVDVRHQIVENHVEEPDEEAMIRSAVQGMIESLEDPYTAYLSPEDLESFDRYITGSFTGIGAEVDLSEGRRLRIVTPLADSPAWEAGVMPGDIVLEIDGESTEDMSLPEAIDRLTGEAGTDVVILVRHESGEKEKITITRDVIQVRSVRGFQRGSDQRFQYMLGPNSQVGYIRVTQFIDKTADELRKALRQVKQQGAEVVILDLRFNPGGLLESALDVSDLFLDDGEMIVSTEGRAVPGQAFHASGETLLPDMPVIVLANEASASAAEIVTGALKDHDRALVIGARTFGKGSVQQVKMLRDGLGAMKITNAYYYLPSGRLIHRREDSDTWGVDPSEGSYVPMNPEQIREMLDTRRQADVVQNGDEPAGTTEVTPEWLEQELKDIQLAAALRAARQRIETGRWPEVGRSDVGALVAANKRANLVQRRNLLKEELAEVEQELTTLASGEPGESAAAAEEPGDEPGEPISDRELPPTDPERVRDAVEQTQEELIEQETDREREPVEQP
ncbi:MAG: S41 family peptidase [Phycisphaeraceae bacterium]